jgi:hypothetical protein
MPTTCTYNINVKPKKDIVYLADQDPATREKVGEA